MAFILGALQRSKPSLHTHLSRIPRVSQSPAHAPLRWISSTHNLREPEAVAAAPAAQEPTPEILHRAPVGGSRVHFSIPEDAIEVFVNGYPVKIPKGMTVLPRFCYHSRLFIAENCRMCLVEVEKSPKPVASYAMLALPG